MSTFWVFAKDTSKATNDKLKKFIRQTRLWKFGIGVCLILHVDMLILWKDTSFIKISTLLGARIKTCPELLLRSNMNNATSITNITTTTTSNREAWEIIVLETRTSHKVYYILNFFINLILNLVVRAFIQDQCIWMVIQNIQTLLKWNIDKVSHIKNFLGDTIL